MRNNRSIALAFFLGALVLSFPVWLLGRESTFTRSVAMVKGTTVTGLIPKGQRHNPWLSDRKNEAYITTGDDSKADSFALDLDCSFTGPKGNELFHTYYATYPTRTAAEAARTKLQGTQLAIHYDPNNQKRCLLDGELAEDMACVPMFMAAAGLFLIISVVAIIRSIIK
jgi:hypothetical protein